MSQKIGLRQAASAYLQQARAHVGAKELVAGAVGFAMGGGAGFYVGHTDGFDAGQRQAPPPLVSSISDLSTTAQDGLAVSKFTLANGTTCAVRSNPGPKDLNTVDVDSLSRCTPGHGGAEGSWVIENAPLLAGVEVTAVENGPHTTVVVKDQLGHTVTWNER